MYNDALPAKYDEEMAVQNLYEQPTNKLFDIIPVPI